LSRRKAYPEFNGGIFFVGDYAANAENNVSEVTGKYANAPRVLKNSSR
jgi:hypothetical protein